MRRALPLLLLVALFAPFVRFVDADNKDEARKKIEGKRKTVDAELAEKRAALAEWCANKGLIKEAQAEYDAAILLVVTNEKWERERTNLKFRQSKGNRPGIANDRAEYQSQKMQLLEAFGKLYTALAKQAREAGLDDLAASLEAQASGTPPAGPTDPKNAPPKEGGKKVAPVLYSPTDVADHVNALRKIAGLDPVGLDDVLSKGAAQHASYLQVNAKDPSVQGLGAHIENKDLPGFTPEGEAAGRASDIEWGPPEGAVDELMSELFHRIPLLRPSLARIGVGQADNGHITVIDVTQGLAATDTERIIAYPAPDQKDVPLRFGSETPDPLPQDAPLPAGFPVTLTEYDRSLKISEVTATLSDDMGEPVQNYLSTPEQPSHPVYQLNTVSMIPVHALLSGKKYTAHVICKVGGNALDKTWSFTTK